MNVLSQRYSGVPEKLGMGSMAGDAAGLVAKGVGKAGMAIGTGAAGLAIGTTRIVGTAALGAGKLALMGTNLPVVGRVPGVPEMAGWAAWSAGKFLVFGGGPVKSPLRGAVKLVGKAAKSMVTYEKGHMEYNRYLGKLEKKGPSLHLSKIGVGALGGLAAVQGIRGGFNAYMGSRMGTVDTKTTSLTPDYSPQEYKIQHPDFAGATGDLAFALHANRHG